MKRGCLISLLSLLAFAGGAYWYFEPRFASPGDWIAAIAAGFFGLFATGCFQNCMLHRTDLKALRQSNGRMVPQDGKAVVAAGIIQPLRGESYNTPFTDKPAVVCEYEAYRMVSTGTGSNRSSHKAVSFGGIHMIPSSINTGVGDVKLLNFPTLVGFPAEPITDAAVRERARAFRETAVFEKVELKNVISRVKDLLVDDDGSVHSDWQNNDEPLESLTLTETYVPAGAQVVAFGIYSAAKGGIIPSLARAEGICRLYNGNAQSVAPMIRNRVLLNLFGVAFFLALAGGLVPFVLKQWHASLDPNSTIESSTEVAE